MSAARSQRLDLTRVALILVLLVPAVLALYLFETFLGTFHELTLQHCRDLLPRVAERIEDNARPENLLWHRFSLEFGNRGTRITAENGVRMAARVREALRVPAEVYCFDDSGRIVAPSGPFPERAEMETFYRAVQNYYLRRPVTPESLRLDREAKRIFRKRYGPPNFFSYLQSQHFGWQCRPPGGSLRHIGFLPISREGPDSLHSAIHIEVADAAIPRAHLCEHGLRAVPDEVGYAAFLASDGAAVIAECRRPWFAPGRLAELPIDGEAAACPDGIFIKKQLGGHDGGFVVVGVPLPFPLGASSELRLALELLFLALAGVLAGHLAGVLLGRRRVRIGMAWQVTLFFVSAGLIPFVTLAYLGASRALEMETLERVKWEQKMVRLLVQADHEFKNWTENLQVTCVEFARRLTARRVRQLTPAMVPFDLRRANPVYFSCVRDVDRGGTMFSGLRTDRERSLVRQVTSMRRVVTDVLRQLLAERGELRGSSRAESPKIMLSVQDVLGEGSPLMEVVKNLGNITCSEFNNASLISFCHLLENSRREAISFILVVLDLSLETRFGFPRIKRQLVPPDSPLRLTTIAELSQKANTDEFDLSFIRETVDRVQDAQSQETLRLTSGRGDEYLLAARYMNFIQGFKACCLLRYAVITDSRRLQLAVILAMFLLALGQIVMVSATLRQAILTPVRFLELGARAVGAGDFRHRVPILDADEFGQLSAAFNAMIVGQQERERMRRFVSASAVADIRRTTAGKVSDANGRSVEVALLASDIRDFTTHSESHPPDAIVEMLNDYFTAMDEVIRDHHGEIRKLIGDAINAVFHNVDGLPHPAERAVRAGLAMRQALRVFNEQRRTRGAFVIENGIGVHFATVVEGRVGAREGRLDYTVIGPATGFAQELEAASKQGTASRVVVSPAVLAVLAGRFAAREFVVAGVPVFEIVGGDPA